MVDAGSVHTPYIRVIAPIPSFGASYVQHVQQHARALNVSQKLHAQPLNGNGCNGELMRT